MKKQIFAPTDVEIASGFGFRIDPEDVFETTQAIPLAPTWLSDEQQNYFRSERNSREKILNLRDLMLCSRNSGCGLVDSSYVEALFGIVHHSLPQPTGYVLQTLEQEIEAWGYDEKPRPSRIVPFEHFGAIMLAKRFRKEVFNL